MVRDLVLARRARKAGAKHSLRIIWEARRARIPHSLGFALVEQESDFENVFGNDYVSSTQVRGGKVTEQAYKVYRAKRQMGLGMQGVGLTQLTWFTYQDAADKLGGAWIPRNQLRIGFKVLSDLIQQRGLKNGLALYNGKGPAARRYADEVMAKQTRWRKVLYH